MLNNDCISIIAVYMKPLVNDCPSNHIDNRFDGYLLVVKVWGEMENHFIPFSSLSIKILLRNCARSNRSEYFIISV